MTSLTRISSQDQVELGYIHEAPFTSIDLSSAFTDPPSQQQAILHADYEGVYILAVASGIVFKFAPSYVVLDSRELSTRPQPAFTWSFGLVPALASVLAPLKRREAARYQSIEINRKLAVAREGKMLDNLRKALDLDFCLNIIQPHLAVPEGIFLPRMESSIQSHIEACKPQLVPLHLQHCWTRQIATSLAWLEQHNLFHGDLKPGNVLLDVHSNAVLADFGSAGTVGEYLRTGCGVYTSAWGKGGAQSEQYAFAWTVYDICHGGHDEQLDEDAMDGKSVPLPERSGVWGAVVQRAWRREYTSMKELEVDVERVYKRCQDGRHQQLDEQDEEVARSKLVSRREGLEQRMMETYMALKSQTQDLETTEKIRPRASTT